MDDAFVGRRRELATLDRKFEQAARGFGSVMLLAGEAGIGKTATARQFASRARAGGGAVLYGASFEGESPPALSPWVQGLASYARTADPARLAALVGDLAPVLARLVPDVRLALAPAVAPPPLAPVEERLRLLDSIARLLGRLAEESDDVVAFVHAGALCDAK